MEGKQDFEIGGFTLRDDVPLPVLSEKSNSLSSDDISPDNIIRGILKLIQETPDHEHRYYYIDLLYTIKPDLDQSLTAAAYEAELNGDYTVALNIFHELLAVSPDNPENILNLAVCYDEYSHIMHQKGVTKEAEKIDDQAFSFFSIIENHVNRPVYSTYYLGRFYLARENYEKAIENFSLFMTESDDIDRKNEVQKVLEEIQDKGVITKDYQYAYELVYSDKELAALEYIDKYIDKYPESWNGHYLKGVALRKLEKFDEAIMSFQEAHKLNPHSSDIPNQIGVCFMNSSNYLQAEKFFFKSLRISGHDAAVYNNLAVLFYKKGDKEQAVKYCDIILELFPEDNEAKNLRKLISEEIQ